MSLNQIPVNRNFLNPTNFQLAINRLPGVEYMCQNIELPELYIDEVNIPNPFNELNYAASSASYGDLTVDFKVDEDLVNYREIKTWIEGLGFPERFQQYKDLKDNASGNKGLRSDASLLISTSEKNANIEVVFRDVFPMRLGSFMMASTDREGTYITARVVFSVRDFVVQVVNQPVEYFTPTYS